MRKEGTVIKKKKTRKLKLELIIFVTVGHGQKCGAWREMAQLEMLGHSQKSGGIERDIGKVRDREHSQK